MAEITDERIAEIERRLDYQAEFHSEIRLPHADVRGLIARIRTAEAQARDAFRAGLLRAAAECDGYAAVIADDPDDLDADGPHFEQVGTAMHLAKELRKLAEIGGKDG